MDSKVMYAHYIIGVGEASSQKEGLWTPQSLLLTMEMQRRPIDSHAYCISLLGRIEASIARYVIT